MTRTAAPKIPGETVTVEPVVEAQPVVETVDPLAPVADLPDAQADTVTVEKVQLDALLAQVAELSNKVRSMETAKTGSKFVVPVADLPDASTINPDTLKTPVLTKQGWLVPETFGSNPNAQKAL